MTIAQETKDARRTQALDGETMHLYRLVPLAKPDDPRWGKAGS